MDQPPTTKGDDVAQTERLLQAAKEAGRRGDASAMLESRWSAGAIQGVTRRLRQCWQALNVHDVDEAVAEGIDALYLAVREGRPVSDPVCYLYKASDHKAYDLYQDRCRETPCDGAILDMRNAGEPAQPSPVPNELSAEERRALAIAAARAAIPRLGQQNIQMVMAYTITAVEQGIEDLTSAQVGEALGLKAATVRTLWMRGFERLAREARLFGSEILPELNFSDNDTNEED